MPYTFKGIISEEGSHEEIKIETQDDIWDYILRLHDEAESYEKGNSTNTLLAVFEQLPFFCSFSSILDKGCQDDIEKYLYCNETSTPAYKGVYGDTPKIWIEKYYIIKRALALKEQRLRQQVKDSKHGNQ